MGRNIKHYNGFYNAQSTNNMDTASTGYTVPSGKVARIGFSFSTYGGSASTYSMSGFYAGTSASGSSSNRFLVGYTPGTTTSNPSNIFGQCVYTAGNGHIFRLTQTTYDGKLFIMNGHICERDTTRTSANWISNNFSYGTYGTLQPYENANTTWTNQYHEIMPVTSITNMASGRRSDVHSRAGEVHAYAGETIYLYDFSGSSGQTNLSLRPFRKCAWDLFIIEEDA